MGTVFAVLSLSAFGFAQTESPKIDISKVEIKNFGRMDARFFRGGQPEQDQFKQLADLGIDTVVNLRDDAEEFEKEAVESLGMKYIHIPMKGGKYPTPQAVKAFRQIMDDPSIGEFFVHCKAGKHRTGAMGAVYRYEKYGWDFDRIYKEMKEYNFYTFLWKFQAIKRFVKDYGEKMEAEKVAENS